MNKAESERLGSLFEQQGYRETGTPGEADVIVLNSCVVRQSAENRAASRLNSLKPLKKSNPGLTLALTGCMVDSNTEHLKKTFPFVDYFFKPGDQPQWIEEAEWEQASPRNAAPAVYVPINQGCNNFCSYCIVPYRRGRERSRLPEDIRNEVKELADRGTREITLLGQNVDSFGFDLPDKPDLADLLQELNDTEGLARLRFLTSHPKDMSSKLISAVASLDKVCEQIHLPVQSGDNAILKLMNRGYTVEHYRKLITEIRCQIPEPAITTDVIVGFPSESEEQFNETVNLLSELKFDTVHVAAYSPRDGTMAARELDDNIPGTEKTRRLKVVEQLQEKTATEINARLLGKTVEVLVEGRKKGKWQGRTRSGKIVFFSDRENRQGQLVTIRIEKTSPWSLQGNPESSK